jgi:hypothetical protein
MNHETKIEDYKSRHKEWRDLSVNQLSNVNNAFTSLGIGFLAFIFKPDLISNLTLSLSEAESKPTFLCCSLVLLISSIALGLIVLLTRLYDFRISRHIALTRQRTMEFYKTKKGLLPNSKHEKINIFHRLCAFFKLVFCRIDFVTRNDIEKKEKSFVKDKFISLQRFADILGSATWKWLKMQILFFLLSIISYGIFLIK